MLSFEFGPPHLRVREPYQPLSTSEKAREKARLRRVSPAGEWHFHTFQCCWRLESKGIELAHDESDHATIHSALNVVSGEKLRGVILDPQARRTTLDFDLGSSLTTSPYSSADDGEEQWSLYLPDGNVLTYGADGRYLLAPGTARPEDVVWRPLDGVAEALRIE